MDFKDIKYLHSGETYHFLLIDGVKWGLTISKHHNDNTYLVNFQLPIKETIHYKVPAPIELNINNPKETIEKFFKLILLC